MFQLYEMMWQAFVHGEISKKLWQDFCAECLDKCMADGQEILIRLKERLKNKEVKTSLKK